jgi:hypothetical protein
MTLQGAKELIKNCPDDYFISDRSVQTPQDIAGQVSIMSILIEKKLFLAYFVNTLIINEL